MKAMKAMKLWCGHNAVGRLNGLTDPRRIAGLPVCPSTAVCPYGHIESLADRRTRLTVRRDWADRMFGPQR